MTTPTDAAVPSTSPLDLLFNAEKLDESLNSSALTYVDRKGVTRLTLAGAVARISAVNPRGAWTTGTLYNARDVVSSSGTWYICLTQHTSGATFAGDEATYWRIYQGVIAADLSDSATAVKGAGMVGFAEATAYGAGTVGAELKKAVRNATYSPATGGTDAGVVISFLTSKASVRYGGSDATPQNDERNFWRGLPSTNSWGNSSNIGLYSAAWNRNGASYAAYSNTWGHDCVTYGVASGAGGAGSCTGDPDAPTSPAFQGYCAFAWGKNVQASGEKATAFGEESKATTRASFAAGYGAETGLYSGSGLGAIALGRSVKAFGEGSVAIGRFVQSSNGSMSIGSGINPGTVMNNQRAGALGFGLNADRPCFYVNPGAGAGGATDVGYTEVFAHLMRFTDLIGGTTLFNCGGIRPIITNTGGSGYGGLQLEATIDGVLTSVCRADSDSNVASFLPTADNSRRLGSATLRWSVVYAGTGTINTSDARLKTDVTPLDDAEKRVAMKVKGLVRKFKFRDAVAEKGAKARWHFGVIAQEVVAAFESEGLDAFAYGLVCRDKTPDGDLYGVRYDELAVFVIAAVN